MLSMLIRSPNLEMPSRYCLRGVNTRIWSLLFAEGRTTGEMGLIRSIEEGKKPHMVFLKGRYEPGLRLQTGSGE